MNVLRVPLPLMSENHGVLRGRSHPNLDLGATPYISEPQGVKPWGSFLPSDTKTIPPSSTPSGTSWTRIIKNKWRAVKKAAYDTYSGLAASVTERMEASKWTTRRWKSSAGNLLCGTKDTDNDDHAMIFGKWSPTKKVKAYIFLQKKMPASLEKIQRQLYRLRAREQADRQAKKIIKRNKKAARKEAHSKGKGALSCFCAPSPTTNTTTTTDSSTATAHGLTMMGQLVLGLRSQEGFTYTVPHSIVLHSTTNSTTTRDELSTFISNVLVTLPQEDWPTFWEQIKIKTKAAIITGKDYATNSNAPRTNTTTTNTSIDDTTIAFVSTTWTTNRKEEAAAIMASVRGLLRSTAATMAGISPASFPIEAHAALDATTVFFTAVWGAVVDLCVWAWAWPVNAWEQALAWGRAMVDKAMDSGSVASGEGPLPIGSSSSTKRSNKTPPESSNVEVRIDASGSSSSSSSSSSSHKKSAGDEEGFLSSMWTMACGAAIGLKLWGVRLLGLKDNHFCAFRLWGMGFMLVVVVLYSGLAYVLDKKGKTGVLAELWQGPYAGFIRGLILLCGVCVLLPVLVPLWVIAGYGMVFLCLTFVYCSKEGRADWWNRVLQFIVAYLLPRNVDTILYELLKKKTKEKAWAVVQAAKASPYRIIRLLARTAATVATPATAAPAAAIAAPAPAPAAAAEIAVPETEAPAAPAVPAAPAPAAVPRAPGEAIGNFVGHAMVVCNDYMAAFGNWFSGQP